MKFPAVVFSRLFQDDEPVFIGFQRQRSDASAVQRTPCRIGRRKGQFASRGVEQGKGACLPVGFPQVDQDALSAGRGGGMT